MEIKSKIGIIGAGIQGISNALFLQKVDELLPQQAAVAEQVRRDILDLYKTWGYQLVVPPLVEDF